MSHEPEFLLRVVRSINEFSAAPPMQIVYTPTHDTSRIQVVSHFGPAYEGALLKHLGHLRLLYPAGSERELRRFLYRALQLPESA